MRPIWDKQTHFKAVLCILLSDLVLVEFFLISCPKSSLLTDHSEFL